MEDKFSTELLVVDISVGMIFQHLEGMTLESDEVHSNGMPLLTGTSVDGNSSPWVTPAIGTWGGATIIEEVVAGVVAEWNGLEERGVPKGWEVVAIKNMSNIFSCWCPQQSYFQLLDCVCMKELSQATYVICKTDSL